VFAPLAERLAGDAAVRILAELDAVQVAAPVDLGGYSTT
jgi:hypothetical protein